MSGERIQNERYELIIQGYGIRIERKGVGVYLDPYKLQQHGQNCINDACRLIEVRIDNGAGPPPYKPTSQEIEAARSAGGGWTKAKLAEWGVPWPPPKGWRKQLEQETP